VLSYVEHGEELHRIWRLRRFLTASLCDGLDGYIARVTISGGAWDDLDPLATSCAGVGIVSLSLHPRTISATSAFFWLTVTVLSRDMLVLLGMVVIYRRAGK